MVSLFVCCLHQVLNREAQMDNPCKWLDDLLWDNITELDKSASNCLSVCLSVCLPVCLFVCLLGCCVICNFSRFVMFMIALFFLFFFRLGSFMGIANSFDQYPREWHQWFTSSTPETTPLPGTHSFSSSFFSSFSFSSSGILVIKLDSRLSSSLMRSH